MVLLIEHFFISALKCEVRIIHRQGTLTHKNRRVTETQMRLFVSAGFSDVRVMRQWENTSIIKARK